MAADPHSLSNPWHVRVVSTHLSIQVDFSKKVLIGHVDHNVEVVQESPVLILDSKLLQISKVHLVKPEESPLEYKLGEHHHVFGSAVEISIPANLRKVGSKFTVRLHYETSPNASALQWLSPKQTAGKVHPYLYSQCQAINARTMLPCQDSPANKFTYTAEVTVPSPLIALMSGTLTKQNGATFYFEQTQPIATYLFAIVAGNIASKAISPRCSVWTEPEFLEASAYEFGNTEKFLSSAEDLLTPYTWGRYDILVLPPSFPYGGMENPQLTFVSSSLLAGDRSLENVAAHEIAHSWMGNLVTYRLWGEYFVTDGLTVFVERKLQGRLYGDDEFDFVAYVAAKQLKMDITRSGGDKNPYSALRPPVEGIDPDDAFSAIPSEKSFIMLCYLQSLVGVERFEKWLKAYVQKFENQSITAEQMKAFFLSSFTDVPDLDKKIDWNAWWDKPGHPIIDMAVPTKKTEAAANLAKRWIEKGSADSSPADIAHFTSAQKLLFLIELTNMSEGKPLPLEIIEALDKQYNFSTSKDSNVEHLLRWYLLSIKAGYTKVFPDIASYLGKHGRMKYTRALYKELHAHPEGKKLAEDTFQQNKDFYHICATQLIAKDLKLE